MWKIHGLILMLIGACFITTTNAWALSESRPVAIDNRIHTILYNENEVFHFVGHYGYQSSIEFEPGEEIATISIGDSVAWQIIPSGSRIFLKPIEDDAGTNMTVITSKRTYHFELEARRTDDIRDPDMIFVLKFVYPESGQYIHSTKKRMKMPDIEENPGKFNFNYTLTGPEHIAPIKIFDDGEFTYFEFRDKNAEVPAFFLVRSDNSESLVNYRVLGNYIVVERVSSRFTLRHGPDVICVFNEAIYRPGGDRVVQQAPKEN